MKWAQTLLGWWSTSFMMIDLWSGIQHNCQQRNPTSIEAISRKHIRNDVMLLKVSAKPDPAKLAFLAQTSLLQTMGQTRVVSFVSSLTSWLQCFVFHVIQSSLCSLWTNAGSRKAWSDGDHRWHLFASHTVPKIASTVGNPRGPTSRVPFQSEHGSGGGVGEANWCLHTSFSQGSQNACVRSKYWKHPLCHHFYVVSSFACQLSAKCIVSNGCGWGNSPQWRRQGGHR